ncbi:MAG TPA: flagellar basal body-associated protein FliL [Beijerinckiaceae bacterium]|jgi:flagellar FliL protein
MAKKPKKGEEAEAAASPAEGEAKPRSRKLLILGAAGLVALLGLSGGGYWFYAHRGGDTAETQKTVKPVAFVDIREMMINLANEPNQERPKVLKFRAALEVKDQKLIAEIQPLLPRIEDAFQVFVRELRASDLEGSAGVYRLREELLRRVNVAVYPAKVDAVLFKDIIVQ